MSLSEWTRGHRWQLAEAGERFRWTCAECALEATTRPTEATPRPGHDDLRVGGVAVRRMPTCGEREPRRIPRRHVWHVHIASDRARWTCKRCGIQAETPASSSHPSCSALRYARRQGDSWAPLTGRLPACEAQP
jgi:hypothetical protein